MRKILIIFIFLIISIFSSYSQNLTIFKEENPDIYFQDLIVSKSGTWLFTVNGEEEYTKLIKVDKDNNILVQSDEFPAYYDDDEVRFTPCFLGVDTDYNVYFYNIETVSESKTNLFVYKMDPEGNIIWKKLLTVPDFKLVLSKGLILNDKFICVGGGYNLESELFKGFIFTLAINDGSIINEKSISDYPVNAFFDAGIINENSFVALLLGYDDINYYTKIYEFKDSLESLNEYDLPESDYFGNSIAILNQDDYVISGFGDDGATIIKYNKSSKSIAWEKKIVNGWDDLDIQVIVENNKIFTLHTAYPKEINPSFPGSEIEIAIHSFSEDGDLLDTLFIDYDPNNNSNLLNAMKSNDGKIYFCGNKDNLQLFETNGIWGYFDMSLLSASELYNPVFSIGIYPNFLSNEKTIHFNSDAEVDNIKIFDVAGNLISDCIFSNSLKTIELPDLHSGIYFLKMESDNGLSIKKLIIN